MRSIRLNLSLRWFAFELITTGFIPTGLIAVAFIATGFFSSTNCLHASEPPIIALTFAPDGKTVVALSQAGVQELAWPELQLRRTIKSDAANLHCGTFSPSGNLLAVGGGNPSEVGIVEVLAWPDAKRIAEFTAHNDSVISLAWLDEVRFVSASLDRLIHLCDLESKEVIWTLSGHSRGVSGLCVLPKESALASVGHDQSVRLWNTSTGKLLRSLSQHTGPIRSVKMRPSSSGLPMIATAASDRTIRFWQPTTGRMVRFVRLGAEPLQMAWTNDGDRVVAVCTDGRCRVIDPIRVKVIREIPAFDGWAYAVAVHPYDQSVAVGGPDGQIRRIELKEPQE